MQRLLLSLLIVTLPSGASILEDAQKPGQPLRILFSGSSTTCGTGLTEPSEPFPSLVAEQISTTFGIEVQILNNCYGGATSLAQLASLKQEGLPLKPDILILQLGTIDGLVTTGSAQAIEAILKLTAATGLPALVIFPFTQYAAVPFKVVAKPAKRYSIPVLNVADFARSRKLTLEMVAPDRVHPNKLGHELIRDGIIQWLTSNSVPGPPRGPRNPKKESTVDRLEFVPASTFIAAAAHPLTRFQELGYGILCETACVEQFEVNTALVTVVFGQSLAATDFSYQIDGKRWRVVRGNPLWLVSHTLLLSKRPKPHHVRLRLESPAVIDGFLVSR